MQEPELDGTLCRKLEIELPFSKLAVDNGKVIFSPQNGFILDWISRSVKSFKMYEYLHIRFGHQSKTTLNSYPPLLKLKS